MTSPLQLVAHNTELSASAAADVRERVERLSHYHDRIISARVTIDVPQRRRRSDALLYGIRIDVTVPGGEFVVDRQPRTDLVTALDGAFKAMRRRLQDHSRRQRGAVKAHQPPEVSRFP